MFDWIADPNAWVALATLTALEIVLGIDNIIFLSILVGRLPPARRNVARRLGLALAMGTRIALLLSLTWIMRLTEPLFTLWQEISGRDLILIAGGLFLLWKSVHEIHNALEGEDSGGERTVAPAAAGFASILVQIAVIDIVFSLDSVITAVGLADQVAVMVLAIVISVGVMMFAARDDQDARARGPRPRRRHADVGRVRRARAEGLHLFRNGVLGRRRDAEHPDARAAPRARAGEIAPAGAVTSRERIQFQRPAAPPTL